MKRYANQTLIVILGLLTISCQENGGADDTVNTAFSGSFEIKTRHAGNIVHCDTTCQYQDAAMGAIDVLSHPHNEMQFVVNFDLDSLSSRVVTGGSLNLFFNSTSNTTMMTRLQNVRVHWLGNECTNTTADFGRSGSDLGVLIDTNAQLAAINHDDKVSIDINDRLQTAINSGHTCFKVLVKADSAPRTHNDRISFTCSYNNTIEAQKALIPSITGTFE